MTGMNNKKNMIKNLIFDFGNVLLVSNFEKYLENLYTDEGEREKVRAIVFDKEFTRKMDLGHQSSEELFAELSIQHPDLAPLLKRFLSHWLDHLFGEMPGMKALMQKYKAMGYKLYGLSNWSDMIYPVMEKYDIFNLLDGRVISCEEHMIKPEPEIYQCLFQSFHLKPEECVFADDKAENVEAGRKMGMPGIVFRNAEQYERELRIILG